MKFRVLVGLGYDVKMIRHSLESLGLFQQGAGLVCVCSPSLYLTGTEVVDHARVTVLDASVRAHSYGA